MKTFVIFTLLALATSLAYDDHINALGVPPQDNHNTEETASRVYQPVRSFDERVDAPISG